MWENECSPRTGSIQWLAMSSRVGMSSPQEKKKVCVEGHHLLNTSRSGLVSLNILQLLEIKMDQWTPESRRLSQKSELRISRSTQWDQSLDAAQRKSKLMGTAWRSPFWINNSKILSRFGTQAWSTEASNPDTVQSQSSTGKEKAKALGGNRVELSYHGSIKGKTNPSLRSSVSSETEEGAVGVASPGTGGRGAGGKGINLLKFYLICRNRKGINLLGNNAKNGKIKFN